MPADSQDPISWLKGIAESATRVRLAPGVLGKSSFLTYGVAIAWIVALWKLSDNLTVDAIIIGAVLLFTLYAMRETKKMRDYAVANPALALMEGADITEYKKFEAQAKGVGTIPPTALTSDPNQPIVAIPLAPNGGSDVG